MSPGAAEVSAGLQKLADPARAVAMAAYMKTDMPFYGVQAPARRELSRRMARRHPFADHTAYLAGIAEIWQLPRREEKYVAIDLAGRFPRFVIPESLPLYETMIRQGAWWDFVDEIAAKLVGAALLKDPGTVWPRMETWLDSSDMWLRRAALLCQLKAKEKTDAARLFAFCLRRSGEREFFIRKAIGWALRQYSYSDPLAVKEFLLSQKESLSGLSFREGAKALRKQGLMP